MDQTNQEIGFKDETLIFFLFDLLGQKLDLSLFKDGPLI